MIIHRNYWSLPWLPALGLSTITKSTIKPFQENEFVEDNDISFVDVLEKCLKPQKKIEPESWFYGTKQDLV